MIPIKGLGLNYEQAQKYIENHICGECGGCLSVSWGGAWGINAYVLRCGDNIEHTMMAEPRYGIVDKVIQGGRIMPIKSLSDVRRLPRLGKIHLGVKVKNEKTGAEYPKRVDYFVCPEPIRKVYGEQPKLLDVIIPVENEELFASQYYRYYSTTRGLICKGDGDDSHRMVDVLTGDIANKDSRDVNWVDGICEGKNCPYYGPKGCSEVMNLEFMLPRVPGIGIWQIDTGSINGIININSCVEYIRGIFGRVSMIPLTLTMVSREVQDPVNLKRQTIYILHLDTNQTFPEMITAVKRLRGELKGAMLALPRGDDTPPDDIDGVPDDSPAAETVVEKPAVVIDQETATTSKSAEQQEVKEPTTSEEDITWEDLQSASKPEGPAQTTASPEYWTVETVTKTVKTLQEHKVASVMGQAFTLRMNNDFKVELPAGVKPNLKTIYELLTSEKKKELCMWLADLQAYDQSINK